MNPNSYTAESLKRKLSEQAFDDDFGYYQLPMWLRDELLLFLNQPHGVPNETWIKAADLEWLRRFLNCTVFGPPPSEIQRAHHIVDALTSHGTNDRLDAERYRWIKDRMSPFVVYYYGSRILGNDENRRNVLTPE